MLATGSRVPRELAVPGRELDGVHFAMEYLYQRNRWVAREIGPEPTAPQPPIEREISARGKDVVVIGGGDTGADCVGNSLREGARSIVQLELLSEPPAQRPDERTPWPQWPLKYRLSYAMEEAGTRAWASRTTRSRPRVSPTTPAAPWPHCRSPRQSRQPPFAPIPGTERELPAQLVLLGDGLSAPRALAARSARRGEGPARQRKDRQALLTSIDGVFAAGDARRGQSLIVWAINEGRQCARMVDRYLAGLGEDGPSDEALAGHADADAGPEGPPQHVGPGIGAA